MSDSVRPHRRQPTRLPRPWDSPGKNTEVGCHFLLQRMKVKHESEVAQSCPTLSDPMDCSHQAPPSMGFSRQEYWSGVPLPSPKEELSNKKLKIFPQGSQRWLQMEDQEFGLFKKSQVHSRPGATNSNGFWSDQITSTWTAA